MATQLTPSAVSVFAVADAEDLDGFAEVLEADAVIAKLETKLWRFDSLQAFHIAFLRREIFSHRS